jgi:hypothetical protein
MLTYKFYLRISRTENGTVMSAIPMGILLILKMKELAREVNEVKRAAPAKVSMI